MAWNNYILPDEVLHTWEHVQVKYRIKRTHMQPEFQTNSYTEIHRSAQSVVYTMHVVRAPLFWQRCVREGCVGGVLLCRHRLCPRNILRISNCTGLHNQLWWQSATKKGDRNCLQKQLWVPAFLVHRETPTELSKFITKLGKGKQKEEPKCEQKKRSSKLSKHAHWRLSRDYWSETLSSKVLPSCMLYNCCLLDLGQC